MLERYVGSMASIAGTMTATTLSGDSLTIDAAMKWFLDAALAAHDKGRRTLFIGNGGSSMIASHMAVDYSKNANIRAQAFNDAGMLTCLGNDFGYPHVFEKQIEMFAAEGDVLVAISSGGRSPNILAAVAAARKIGCAVLTLSGFKPDNPLRNTGDVNVYVPSDKYGYVEILHLTFLHAVSDLHYYGAIPDALSPTQS